MGEVASAWGRAPVDWPGVLQWKAVWRDAAAATVASLLKDYSPEDRFGLDGLQEELEMALSTGVQGTVVYDAHRFLSRQGMKAEDYDWQLERERERLRCEDEDEERWQLKQERRKMQEE